MKMQQSEVNLLWSDYYIPVARLQKSVGRWRVSWSNSFVAVALQACKLKKNQIDKPNHFLRQTQTCQQPLNQSVSGVLFLAESVLN